ncbi:MAG: hypothetical protein ACOY90_21920 [Candidatus Zhuqueibacterota bacterium]
MDSALISEMNHVHLKLFQPERRDIVFQGETDWEDNTMSFIRVLQDGEKVRLYYRASMVERNGKRIPVMALAESGDGGFSFVRPALRLVEFNGSSENNILRISDIPTVPPPFIDTNSDCPPGERYKGLSGEWKMCFALASPDGLRWHLMSEDTLEMSGTFDTVNTAFWDPQIQAYRCFTRYFENLTPESDVLSANNVAIRAIQSAVSRDFIRWEQVTYHQYGDGQAFHMYTNATIPCPGAGHIYLAFPNRYVQDRIFKSDHPYPGMNDALFMSSRDCVHWTRFPEAWIRPGLDEKNWTDRNNYPTWGIIESSATEWSMYVSEHYRQPDVKPRLRRLSVRPRGFVSVHAQYEAGTFTTKPLIFSGNRLQINYSTSAIGAIFVEVQDSAGVPLAGFSRADCRPIFGDDLERTVVWENGSDLSRLAGAPIRLRFELSDADIFAFRVHTEK